MLEQLSRTSRVLLLCQGLEGSTTNLTFFIQLSRDLKDYHARLGIESGPEKAMVQMGLFQRGRHHWAFYSISRRRDCIVGSVHDPTYKVVVRAWFMIQKTKQALATLVSGTRVAHIGGPGRNNYVPVAPIVLGGLDVNADAESNDEYYNDEVNDAE